MRTTFGTLPIGAKFTVWRRERDTNDRRRRVDVRRHYTKTRHGTIAGYAIGSRDEPRFEHYDCVDVADNDLRLLISIARHQAKPCE